MRPGITRRFSKLSLITLSFIWVLPRALFSWVNKWWALQNNYLCSTGTRECLSHSKTVFKTRDQAALVNVCKSFCNMEEFRPISDVKTSSTCYLFVFCMFDCFFFVCLFSVANPRVRVVHMLQSASKVDIVSWLFQHLDFILWTHSYWLICFLLVFLYNTVFFS